tara:strand:+ start:232 stop:558 length:327 start_codon:yes stop_codon:yes gene_type:complete
MVDGQMNRQNLKLPYIFVILLSLIAVFPMPYGYYSILRICVCVCGLLTAYIDFQNGKPKVTTWLCILLAVIFNPVIPIHLTREIWLVLNVIAAWLFGYLTYNISRKED